MPKNNKLNLIKYQISPNGFPLPLKTKCFQCSKTFFIKFVIPRQAYSQKNNWGYWTNQIKDKLKWICNSCLRRFYCEERENFLATIKDLKKRNHLRSYVSHGVI